MVSSFVQFILCVINMLTLGLSCNFRRSYLDEITKCDSKLPVRLQRINFSKHRISIAFVVVFGGARRDDHHDSDFTVGSLLSRPSFVLL